MYMASYKTFEAQWKGVINKSTLRITYHLCELLSKQELQNKKMFYVWWGMILALVFFSIRNGLDIRSWIDTKIDIVFLGIIVSGFYILVSWLKQGQKLKNDIDRIKELLSKRIDADFCSCNTSCNHKEEYLSDMEEICKINLYY